MFQEVEFLNKTIEVLVVENDRVIPKQYMQKRDREYLLKKAQEANDQAVTLRSILEGETLPNTQNAYDFYNQSGFIVVLEDVERKPFVREYSPDLTTNVEVTLPGSIRKSNYSIGAEAVNANNEATDSDGNALATAGEVEVQVRSGVTENWQTLYQSDGSTPVTIDISSPESVDIMASNIHEVKVVPDGNITGGSVERIRLTVSEYE